jgi:hypothetical protein
MDDAVLEAADLPSKEDRERGSLDRRYASLSKSDHIFRAGLSRRVADMHRSRAKKASDPAKAKVHSDMAQGHDDLAAYHQSKSK